ncbi:protein EMSY-LIKE 3 isoform X1 [Populus alba]|uniref:protein EMSY-LIKE 3 isoform X1 n=2 Tax=Populus alba TaxID=43335 RepID=UPI00158E2F6A|nr:protein EMSY-LIKE 3-like isoform X1 [Populus alba]XP_034892386.1 protein EMSY-LIKE 3-like isoform X1 [Populus alba]
MDYELSDSSGTDDDLPPTHRNRFQSGVQTAGNGRSAVVGGASQPSLHSDMETQIHNIEQEAYTSVLRAFKAQSDAITWEKESLITELRKELRVSDEEHRELLARVNADDIIRRIREWRKANGIQPSMPSTTQPSHNPIASPSASGSRKKQKTSQSVASLSMGAPSPVLHPSMQQSTSALRHGPPPGSANKKPKSSMQRCSTGLSGRAQVANHGSSGAFAANDLIGKKVWTQWPEDNHFYEAVITDYNAVEGRHALVYDINTGDETWEWVNLKEIPPEDIRWEDEETGLFRRGGRPGPGRGNKKSIARGGAVAAAGRGRGTIKGQSKKDFSLTKNGAAKKAMGDIEILHTDTLIKEVEKVFGASHPDPLEIEKAKKVLREQEQALVKAIARLEDASDGESADEGEHPFPHIQSKDQNQNRGWRKQPCNEIAGEGRGIKGSGGNKMARNGRIVPSDHHDENYDM